MSSTENESSRLIESQSKVKTQLADVERSPLRTVNNAIRSQTPDSKPRSKTPETKSISSSPSVHFPTSSSPQRVVRTREQSILSPQRSTSGQQQRTKYCQQQIRNESPGSPTTRESSDVSLDAHISTTTRKFNDVLLDAQIEEKQKEKEEKLQALQAARTKTIAMRKELNEKENDLISAQSKVQGMVSKQEYDEKKRRLQELQNEIADNEDMISEFSELWQLAQDEHEKECDKILHPTLEKCIKVHELKTLLKEPHTLPRVAYKGLAENKREKLETARAKTAAMEKERNELEKQLENMQSKLQELQTEKASRREYDEMRMRLEELERDVADNRDILEASGLTEDEIIEHDIHEQLCDDLMNKICEKGIRIHELKRLLEDTNES